MNLKIDDLENNDNKNTMRNTDNMSLMSSGQETSLSKLTIESSNLIQQSMKEAILQMGTHKQSKKTSNGPPREYERIIQKLEADIRGHIRLEHEMKIHMDYLEAKVEKFEKEQKQVEEEKRLTAKKISQLQEKINLFKTDRDDQVKQTKKLKIRLDEMKKMT